MSKNAFCEEDWVEIFEFWFDIVEHKPVSMGIGVIDRGKEARWASGAGDQEGANGVFWAELGDQPELPECKSFLVLAFGATK